MSALVPYAGCPRAIHTGRPRVPVAPLRPRLKVLDELGESKALMLFRIGNDTVEIADILHCTQAAAANGLAHAKLREFEP